VSCEGKVATGCDRGQKASPGLPSVTRRGLLSCHPGQ
jgi:hypothetical protein